MKIQVTNHVISTRKIELLGKKFYVIPPRPEVPTDIGYFIYIRYPNDYIKVSKEDFEKVKEAWMKE